MTFITLTTDFGLKDYSVGAVKGRIYSELPDAKIVDISHQITPFNIIETAYILKNAYKNFPEGTIHIVGVDAEQSPIKRHLLVKLDGHFFICADNGIISMITSEIEPTEIFKISSLKTSFPTLNIFTKIACDIIKGKPLSEIGTPINEYKKLAEIQPEISENGLKAKVVYIDHYNNIVTNISKSLFDEIANGRAFKIHFERYDFTKIYNQYNDIVDFDIQNIKEFEGKRLALFNSEGMLEIAMFKGNSKSGGASSLLGISYGDTISIIFE